MNRIQILILLVACSLFVACGGSSMGGGGKSNLDEAKAMNAEISGSYQAIMDTYEGLKSNASGFAAVPADVDLSAIDPADMQKMFMDCLQTPVKVTEKAQTEGAKAAGGNAKAGEKGADAVRTGLADLESCPGALEGGAVSKVEGTDAAAMQTLTNKIQTIDTIRKQLYLIPAQSKAFGVTVTDNLVTLGKLEAASLAEFEASKLNPLADKAKEEKKYNTIKAELDSVKGVADKAKGALTDVVPDSANIGQQLLLDIKDFPSQPGS